MSKPTQAFPAVGQQAPAVVITLTAVRWDGGEPVPGMVWREERGSLPAGWWVDRPRGGDEMIHPGWWVVTAPTGERWVADPATMERLYGIREVQP